MSTTDYRWNQSQAAVDYDAAAPIIHPQYVTVQDELLAALPFAAEDAFRLVDVGGGSGRLVERVLEQFPNATAMVMDQSEPFLGVAQQRLARFGSRAAFIKHRLQDEWTAAVGPVDAVVSTSAIHHLEPAEKQQLFAKIFASLPGDGVFVNGDEHRPAGDAEYLALLEQWGRHMASSLAAGAIPESFGTVIDAWTKRNNAEFGSPRSSGDDCLETIETQVGYLRAAGFNPVDVPWRHELWAVFVARKLLDSSLCSE
jgi:tRNA (cmo5U34)-methyltransferase